MSALYQGSFISDLGDLAANIENFGPSCIYFCSHFYKVFKEKKKIRNASILDSYVLKEALCYCLSCRDKIKKHLRIYDTSNDRFFFEARKRFIQYHPKIYENNNLFSYINFHV